MPYNLLAWDHMSIPKAFESKTHRGHNGLSIVSPDITERHLGAFMLVDVDLRIVDILDLLEGH